MNSKSIAIITENFLAVWRPADIQNFLGGSQECVVLFADALKRKGYNVSVFLYGPTVATDDTYNGISYSDFSAFDAVYDTIVLFKINPLELLDDSRLDNANVIFWSSDVVNNVSGKYIKKRVCLTEYHKQRTGWSDALVIPHGVDFTSLDDNEAEKEPNTAIYCSSLDRGFLTLLKDARKIKESFPDLKIYTTYGFKITRQITGLSRMEDEMELKKTCEASGLTYLADVSKKELEKLYWSCGYWILPLNKPDSELFCLNAIKTQYCGCIPVVYKLGALTETVGAYIPYDNFVNGDTTLTSDTNVIPSYSWDYVIDNYWSAIL